MSKSTKPLVSFGCPSKRPIELGPSIASVIDGAGDRLDQIEIIIHVHDGDDETMAVAESFPKEVVRIIRGSRLRGRPDLPTFFNRCLVGADAHWYWAWSDDMRLLTPDYLNELARIDHHRPWILHTANSRSFMILSEPVVLALNREPYQTITCDWYLERIADACGIFRRMPGIDLLHKNIHEESDEWCQPYVDEFWSSAVQTRLQRDIETIRRLVAGQLILA